MTKDTCWRLWSAPPEGSTRLQSHPGYDFSLIELGTIGGSSVAICSPY
jgi:hypothetical protein